MIKWEIDFERISASISDTEVREKLNKRGADGWEPYEIVGITHFFKRCVTETVVAPKTEVPAKKKK